MVKELHNMLNAKKKGNRGENVFANWLVDNGIKAWKDSASGGGNNEKGDIGNNLNIHFEVKTVKKIGLMEVWKKATLECQKTHNAPVLAIHFDGMPEKEWLMVIHSEHFLELLNGGSPIETVYDDPKKKWAVQNLIESAKKVIKLYEH